ncbi:helix-turn-helix transcriptional regulator [Propionibacterium freudenreichii]|uniref:helix-turn-helix transcriptional regulator n=1 Tax=Propionibacterium freudenreichii TaxID=1744 RepID=UPI000BC2D398|nr:helix-turn-helix domain-containing protein [Propionibacterium freudenreichii]MDK9301716.1 helix-turn-helix transcriptional regulator [Propionibacterium freudenreichii]MDK9321119.1 helix-turn-helix transcriptional regulator [Propionibacterium freudenreichii]MDK9323532.1 helix-turn-helix transcriptional regulator [Propionibacterium freudenreichii]MDK9339794.1 helix-turn-helix transcriptional regulator [Propionibacterium freudenreichii]MDK9648498.1 helix-turn-helix transcriptional regulator [P
MVGPVSDDEADAAEFAPLHARTSTLHRPVDPLAFDWIRLIFVRDGSAILFSEFGQKPVKSGDVVLLGANVLCGSEPEGHITVTTIYADTDYILDQVRWQYAGFLQDRLDAQGFADTLYTEPAQILRLGEDRAGMMLPWLDEMVARSIDGNFVRDYLRMQALWFQIAYVIAPFIKVSPVRISPSQRAHIRPTLPRDRRFAPLRAEVRQAADLLRANPERRWSLDDLAAAVHLSPSRLSSVFVEAYGKTPLAFLTMIRAESLAKYLRETDLTVTAAMQRVGWHSRSHASRLFRQYVGLTPGHYRRLRPHPV